MPDSYDDIDTETDDPFALADDGQAEDDPFASSGSSSVSEDDYDEYEVPPTPIGVLPSFVKSAKYVTTEKNGTSKLSLVLAIECSHPDYSGASTNDLWLELPKQIERAQKVAIAFGLRSTRVGGKIRLPSPSQFVNRPGLVVYSTYIDKNDSEAPTIAWGMPKPGKSAAFDAWRETAGLTDEQVKKIAGSPGILPIDALS